MSPRWGDVYAALLAKLPELPEFADVPVYDGYPLTGDAPADWVTIGFVTDDGAGSFQQTPDLSGFATTEQGEIKCHLASNAGDTDMTVTRGRALALFAAWQTWLVADQTLGGVLSPASVVNLSAQMESVQTSKGSGTGLIVTVSYQTTTYV